MTNSTNDQHIHDQCLAEQLPHMINSNNWPTKFQNFLVPLKYYVVIFSTKFDILLPFNLSVVYYKFSIQAMKRPWPFVTVGHLQLVICHSWSLVIGLVKVLVMVYLLVKHSSGSYLDWSNNGWSVVNWSFIDW
jgi:hypothetical protein